jgi:hypothetical protein
MHHISIHGDWYTNDKYNTKFCLYLIKGQVMQTNRGIRVPIHAFLTLTLDGDLPAPRLGRFSSAEYVWGIYSI